MWRKNLDAVINEAIASSEQTNGSMSPGEKEVEQLLRRAEAGQSTESELPSGGWLRSCTADDALLVEAQRDTRVWVHRHYSTA